MRAEYRIVKDGVLSRGDIHAILYRGFGHEEEEYLPRNSKTQYAVRSMSRKPIVSWNL